MQETRDPIQELLIAARRTQILDAAAAVFAEKGFHRATIKDIARAAGIADGTIYTYFSSKTGVLLGLLNRLNESTERQEQFALGSEQDFRAFFIAYLRQRMSLLWSNAEVFRVLLSEMLVNVELRELYYQQVIMPTFKVAEQYLLAKMLSLMMLALLEGTLLAILINGFNFNPLPWFAGLLLLSGFYTLLGFAVIARYRSLNESLLPSALVVAVLVSPILNHFGLWRSFIFYLHPVQPALSLLRSAFMPVAPWEIVYGLLVH